MRHFFAALIVLSMTATMSVGPRSAPSRAPRAAAGHLPLVFEPNLGQAAPAAKFVVRGNGYGLMIGSSGLRLAAGNGPDVAITLAGANPIARAEGVDLLRSHSNYLIGNDPARWRTNVPNFGKVRVPDIYPGIEAVYYGSERQLEYDFVVAPAADPSAIRMTFSHRLSIDANGDLVAAGTALRLRRPAAYQRLASGQTRSVAVRYQLNDQHETSFALGAYDTSLPLVIDPVLLYSTYLGGSNTDTESFMSGRTVAVDAGGHAYVAGFTRSIDFTSTDGSTQHCWVNPDNPADRRCYTDAFVTKLSTDGTSIVYSTYLGGNFEDWANGIAVDGSGNAYVTGYTQSGDFPQTGVAHAGSIFVTKLKADGSGIAYSWRIGGPDGDVGNAIAVDATGAAYVTGAVWHTDSLPADLAAGAAQASCFCSPGWHDNERSAFVVKVNPAGTALDYATYLGGSDGEAGVGIDVDGGGNAYVTGFTGSTNFPVVNAAQPGPASDQDAFVTKVNSTGTAWVYSTYLGGSRDDNHTFRGDGMGGIAVDGAGNAYVTGYTNSPNFPTTPDAYQTTLRGGWDAFVTKFDASGAIAYSTFLGGNDQDTGYSIAVDGGGSAFVTGSTHSSDFPTMNPVQASAAGNDDVFVTRLSADGRALLFSTYIGGASGDFGRGIAVDASGAIYVAGNTGSNPTPGANTFPVTPGAAQTTSPGDVDMFVLKIGEPHVNHAPVAQAGGDQVLQATSPAGAAAALDGSGSNDADGDALTYAWTEGAVAIGSGASPTVTLSLGTHTLTLTVDDGQGGTSADTVDVVVQDTIAPAIGATTDISVVASSPSGAVVTYPLPAATDAVDPSPVITGSPASGSSFPVGTTTVYLTASDFSGNTSRASFTVTVTAATTSRAAQMASALFADTDLAGFQQARGLLQSIILRAPRSGSGDKASCGQIGAFINQVQAQTGKQISATIASNWIAAGIAIRAEVGCR